MVIDGVEVARKSFLSCDRLSALISEMKKERKIKNEDKEPTFYLEDVPSGINSFKSLIRRT
jgi:hypothetical protein